MTTFDHGQGLERVMSIKRLPPDPRNRSYRFRMVISTIVACVSIILSNHPKRAGFLSMFYLLTENTSKVQNIVSVTVMAEKPLRKNDFVTRIIPN